MGRRSRPYEEFSVPFRLQLGRGVSLSDLGLSQEKLGELQHLAGPTACFMTVPNPGITYTRELYVSKHKNGLLIQEGADTFETELGKHFLWNMSTFLGFFWGS